MSIKTIRLVETDRDLLVRLKRSTGVKGFNILCRWAFCMSLADRNPTSVDPIGALSNLEIDWDVFAGGHQEVYWALLVQRVHEDGLPGDNESLAREFNRHLHRGIGLLANLSQKPSIRNVVSTIS
jgi:DNA sulfur modification protein DndE